MEIKNINEIEENNGILDLRKFIFMFRRRWQIIFGFFLVCAVTSSIYMYSLTAPVYQASTMLFVYRSNDTSATLNYEINIGAQLVKDVASILKSGPVVEGTIKKLGSPKGLTRNSLVNNIKSSIINETRLLKIVITDKDPIMAAKIANTISGVVIERFDFIMKAKISKGDEFISIVENAAPDYSPVNSNKRLAIIGISLLGLLLGLGTGMLLEYLNNAVRSQDEVEWYFGSSVIAVIPKFHI